MSEANKSPHENIPMPPKGFLKAVLAASQKAALQQPTDIEPIKIGLAEVRIWANQQNTLVKVSSPSKLSSDVKEVVAILEMAFEDNISQTAALKGGDTLVMNGDHANYGDGKDCTVQNVKALCQALSTQTYDELKDKAVSYAATKAAGKEAQEKSWREAHKNEARAEVQPHVNVTTQYLEKIGKALTLEEIEGLREALVEQKVKGVANAK